MTVVDWQSIVADDGARKSIAGTRMRSLVAGHDAVFVDYRKGAELVDVAVVVAVV